MNVASAKSFLSGGSVFSSVSQYKTHHLISVPQISKKECTKESKHPDLFPRFFLNFHACVQKKSIDYKTTTTAMVYLQSGSILTHVTIISFPLLLL